jgi:hypothetical protein
MTRKRASFSLNRAGSSILRMWPVLANIARPDAGMVCFRNRLRVDTGVVLVAGDDGARVVIRRWQAFNAAFCLPFDHAESVIIT